MEFYDPAKVGKRIAWGRSHAVYHYGSGEVIRFPRAEKLLWGSSMLHRFERDISVCKNYLGEYFLDTRIVQDPKSENIATIQSFITGHYLSKRDLIDPFIKKQFDDFLKRHEALRRDGYGPIANQLPPPQVVG